MVDDPDRRMEEAEPPSEALCELAGSDDEPSIGSGKPYHHAIAPELAEELHLYVGKGLALAGIAEDATPEQRIRGLADWIDRRRAGSASAPSDASEAALALACVFGQAVCRELGWGWAHVRRVKRPGIVVMSPDASYAIGPRGVIDKAMEHGGHELPASFERLRSELPESSPGRYLRLD
jgi:hypothetical protein